MISAPTAGAPDGPLEAPDEQELGAAYPELRDHAMTISWAAEVLGMPAAQLEELTRSGARPTAAGSATSPRLAVHAEAGRAAPVSAS